MSEKIVKKDDFVKVQYTGKFEDGNIFDSSEGREPLEVIAGNGMLIKGFDEALIGMKSNEEKDVVVEPSEGYGAHNPSLVQKVPKSALGDNIKNIKVGTVLGMQIPNTEHSIPVQVTKIEEETIELDANHPLAGKKLNFHIKIVEAREATEEDKKKFMQHNHEDEEECDDEEGCSGNCSSCGHHH
ncbi:MAG: peptidylprolyl isomerase [Candidatus Woesearchaeota archaeon]